MLCNERVGLAVRIRLWAHFFSNISYSRDLGLVTSAFRRRRRFRVPEETWLVTQSIGGYLSLKEAGLLYWAAAEWPVAGPVLELGSYEGRSTVVLARAGRRVYAVDAWSLDVDDLSAYSGGVAAADEAFHRFQDNLRRAQVEAQVDICRGLTQEVGQRWDISGAILFIDAGHSYADVKADLEIWTPHLLAEGLLLMHDVLGGVYLDVTQAASELLGEGWRVVASAGSVVAFARE